MHHGTNECVLTLQGHVHCNDTVVLMSCWGCLTVKNYENSLSNHWGGNPFNISVTSQVAKAATKMNIRHAAASSVVQWSCQGLLQRRKRKRHHLICSQLLSVSNCFVNHNWELTLELQFPDVRYSGLTYVSKVTSSTHVHNVPNTLYSQREHTHKVC